MRHFTIIFTCSFLCFFKAKSQVDSLFQFPIVNVKVTLNKNVFKAGSDIRLTMTLRNLLNSEQSVWFDRPKSSTGGPAWTSVSLTNKKTGKSVLEYDSKATLESQIYSTDEVKKLSYNLKPGQKVSGQFSLYDLVVLKNYKHKLDRGNYEMEIFYYLNSSGKISFTID